MEGVERVLAGALGGSDTCNHHRLTTTNERLAKDLCQLALTVRSVVRLLVDASNTFLQLNASTSRMMRRIHVAIVTETYLANIIATCIHPLPDPIRASEFECGPTKKRYFEFGFRKSEND